MTIAMQVIDKKGNKTGKIGQIKFSDSDCGHT